MLQCKHVLLNIVKLFEDKKRKGDKPCLFEIHQVPEYTLDVSLNALKQKEHRYQRGKIMCDLRNDFKKRVGRGRITLAMIHQPPLRLSSYYLANRYKSSLCLIIQWLNRVRTRFNCQNNNLDTLDRKTSSYFVLVHSERNVIK